MTSLLFRGKSNELFNLQIIAAKQLICTVITIESATIQHNKAYIVSIQYNGLDIEKNEGRV